jgi:hypothetical protein
MAFDNMESDDFLGDELRAQLVFFFNLKEGLKDLDDRIRTTALYLARKDLESRHRDVTDWDIVSRPDESTVTGRKDGEVTVTSRIRTMSLHGKSTFGGRQHDAMKRNLEKISEETALYKYLYLLDPWTVSVVVDTFNPVDITVLSLLKEDMAQVVRTTSDTGDAVIPGLLEPSTQMVEEVITQEEFPEERTIVSPISRTSIRQGFLYIPKEKGELLQEGSITIWIRKDASLVSKCMISQTGGVRIGGGLTKWFRSVGLQPDDELVMGAQEDGSLLVLMIRRNQPFKPSSPMIETVKWD